MHQIHLEGLLGINLTKDVQDLYTAKSENSKTFLKEVKEGLNKYRNSKIMDQKTQY